MPLLCAALIVSNSLTVEKKHGRVSKAPRGKKSPWPPPPLHTHCQILINRRLPSFIDESVYIKIQVPLVRRGSHLGSGSWLCSGLGERLSASWRKSTVLDPGIVPPHLLRFTSCPWVCEPTGHVDFSHNNKKMVTVIHGKLFSVLWWVSPNVKVHSSLTVHNSQRCNKTLVKVLWVNYSLCGKWMMSYHS